MEKLPVLNKMNLNVIASMSDKKIFDDLKQWNNILFEGYMAMSAYIYQQKRLEQHGLTEEEQQMEDHDKNVLPQYMSVTLHMLYMLENRMVKKKSEYIT